MVHRQTNRQIPLSKRFVFVLLLIVAFTLNPSVARATTVSDDFSYPDGNLIGNGSWSAHSGAGSNQIQVVSGQAQLVHGSGSREDAGLPLGVDLTSGTVTATFDLTVSDDTTIAGSDFEYFAHFMAEGSFNFRARVDVVAPTAGGDYTLGISSQSSTAEATLSSDFTYGVPIAVSISYDLDAQQASLTAGGETVMGSVLESGDTLNRFALRQSDSSNDETILIDNLVVTDGGGADTTPPSIATLNPADDATGVAIDADLVATFDENVQKGTGNITIHLASDNSVVETIDVTTAAITASDAEVTIDPSTDLTVDTAYYVNIAAGAIEDLAGNDFAGFSDATTWNFTTGNNDPPAPASQLLLTEIAVTPDGGEFIEIYNPGDSTVDLSNVYLTDATFTGNPSTFYYNIVTGTNAGGGGFGDFHARFPDGASIAAGAYQTIALNGSANFMIQYSVAPTYELFDDGTSNGEQVLREAFINSINGQGGLSNGGEVVILYYWDGASDLVTDLDYALWGDKAEAVDKSGIAIDGPDADSTTSTYLNDTATASQDVISPSAHSGGESWQREDLTEGTEAKSGGNGVDGHDETSEDLSNTWCQSSTPTPNAASQCPSGVGTPAKIYEIQGSGTASPFDGQLVETSGIVVADFQGSDELNGFFLQDATGDGNMDTSDGIFVYDPSGDDVNVGDIISLTAEVDEFNTLTELKNVINMTIDSSGNSLPSPAQVTLPESTDGDLEKYEGMLVQITDASTMFVAQNFFLGRYGQMTLSAGQRTFQPTNQELPGSAAAIALAEDNAKRLLILDDGQDISRCGDNPDPVPYIGSPPPSVIRGGDKVSNLIGVLDFGQINSGSDGSCASPSTTFARDYRLHPTTVPNFTAMNARTNTPDNVGGTFKVATLNVLNYFNGDGAGGGFPTSRGADTASEFTRQRDKIINALVAIDADVVGLVEIENDGYGANSAIQDLVNGLNAELGAGTYAFIDPGVNMIGTDEIAVAFIYKSATTDPVGAAAILDSTFDTDFIDTKNRPVLAQTFSQKSNGARFTAAVNHLKSKGSACDDVGDPVDPNGQGNCNQTRTKAATVLANWLATDPTSSNDPDFIILGDLNAYAMEDPVTALKNAGYTDLINQFLGNSTYSFTFDGLVGYLDHAMANASLTAQVTGVAEWHINTDEPAVIDYNEDFNPAGYYDGTTPFRASDHDPVIVGLNLAAQLNTEDNITQQGVTTSYNGQLSNCPTSAVDLPIHSVTPTVENTSNPAESYANLYFEVIDLAYTGDQGSNTPTLCNADGGVDGGVGARLTIPLTGDLADGVFGLGDIFAQELRIGLPARARYRLFVNLMGTPSSVLVANSASTQQLKRFQWEFDAEGNLIGAPQQEHTLYLPVVVR